MFVEVNRRSKQETW